MSAEEAEAKLGVDVSATETDDEPIASPLRSVQPSGTSTPPSSPRKKSLRRSAVRDRLKEKGCSASRTLYDLFCNMDGSQPCKLGGVPALLDEEMALDTSDCSSQLCSHPQEAAAAAAAAPELEASAAGVGRLILDTNPENTKDSGEETTTTVSVLTEQQQFWQGSGPAQSVVGDIAQREEKLLQLLASDDIPRWMGESSSGEASGMKRKARSAGARPPRMNLTISTDNLDIGLPPLARPPHWRSHIQQHSNEEPPAEPPPGHMVVVTEDMMMMAWGCVVVPPDYAIVTENPDSPCTPASSPTPRKLVCPDPPSIRGRELHRQGSLMDTKMLVTTKLKRSLSTFGFNKHFEFLREIGGGSFSTVYEARDVRANSLCAVKRSRRQFTSREDRDRYVREIQTVANLMSEHAHIVKYYCGWQQDAYFYVQMELCEGGNLRTYLDKLEAPLEEQQVWKFVQQIAAGLEHIHAAGVVHLDIKPENVLLDSQGDLKIGDFGSAIQKKQASDWEEGDGGYVAPELLLDQAPSPACDMYSFGAMVFEWAARVRLPRSGMTTESKAISLANCSPQLAHLVIALLDPEPSARPTAADVLRWARD